MSRGGKKYQEREAGGQLGLFSTVVAAATKPKPKPAANKPPKGYHPAPKSRKGGWTDGHGNYWYPQHHGGSAHHEAHEIENDRAIDLSGEELAADLAHPSTADLRRTALLREKGHRERHQQEKEAREVRPRIELVELAEPEPEPVDVLEGLSLAPDFKRYSSKGWALRQQAEHGGTVRYFVDSGAGRREIPLDQSPVADHVATSGIHLAGDYQEAWVWEPEPPAAEPRELSDAELRQRSEAGKAGGPRRGREWLTEVVEKQKARADAAGISEGTRVVFNSPYGAWSGEVLEDRGTQYKIRKDDGTETLIPRTMFQADHTTHASKGYPEAAWPGGALTPEQIEEGKREAVAAREREEAVQATEAAATKERFAGFTAPISRRDMTKRVKAALRALYPGHKFSVRGGTGTGYNWIKVHGTTPEAEKVLDEHREKHNWRLGSISPDSWHEALNHLEKLAVAEYHEELAADAHHEAATDEPPAAAEPKHAFKAGDRVLVDGELREVWSVGQDASAGQLHIMDPVTRHKLWVNYPGPADIKPAPDEAATDEPPAATEPEPPATDDTWARAPSGHWIPPGGTGFAKPSQEDVNKIRDEARRIAEKHGTKISVRHLKRGSLAGDIGSIHIRGDHRSESPAARIELSKWLIAHGYEDKTAEVAGEEHSLRNHHLRLAEEHGHGGISFNVAPIDFTGADYGLAEDEPAAAAPAPAQDHEAVSQRAEAAAQLHAQASPMGLGTHGRAARALREHAVRLRSGTGTVADVAEVERHEEAAGLAPGNHPIMGRNPVAGELSRGLAERAFQGTSWSPARRADSVQASYVDHLTAFGEKLARVAGDDPEKVKQAAEAFAEYRKGYRRKVNAWLEARTRVMSTMVTGGARFPTASNRKKGDTADKRAQEIESFTGRQKRILNDLDPKVISSDRGDARELLTQRIKEAEEAHERYKKGNRILKKKDLSPDEKRAQLEGLGVHSRLVEMAMRTDFGWSHGGFNGFDTKGSLARIKRDRERLANMAQEAERPSFAQHEFEGGVTIEDDAKTNRIRVHFEERPDADMIAKLKANGFRWSRREGAWQRHRNDNTRHTLRHQFGWDVAADLTKGERGSIFGALLIDRLGG